MAPNENDDIFRNIDTKDTEACDAECLRLWKKRKGLKSFFTQSNNQLTALIEATTQGGYVDTTTSTKEALDRLRTKLEKAYDKLAMAMNRVIEINQLDDSHATSKAYVAEEKQVLDTYCKMKV